MAKETTSDGVWIISEDVSNIELMDAIHANMEQLEAMSVAIIGNGSDAFELKPSDLKNCYLMALSQKIENTKILVISLARRM